MIDAGAALRAERARLGPTTVAFYFERFQRARVQLECAARDGEAHPERAARLALAFDAVAYSEAEWLALDSIPDAAALTAAVDHAIHTSTSRVLGCWRSRADPELQNYRSRPEDAAIRFRRG